MTVQKARAVARSGFTLMEVLVVVAILVILAGVGSVAVFRYLDEAKENAARLGIKNIETAVKAYKLSPGGTGDYPADLSVLTQNLDGKGASLEQQALLDPWGQPYVYEPENRHPLTGTPHIYSHGASPNNPNGRISNWAATGG